MSILQKLTEGVQNRDLRAEGAALLNKWEATGLLEGLNSENQKQGMAVLLENQAKELLREASSMAAGDVEGFAAVAFPIVRRVFGGLIANDLVSVQPMSLPSGLIFFLDFTHEDGRLGAPAGSSVYGGNVVAKGLVGGVDLDAGLGGGPGGHYDLGHGAASAMSSSVVAHANVTGQTAIQGTVGTIDLGTYHMTDVADIIRSGAQKEFRFDADLLANTSARVQVVDIPLSQFPNLDQGRLGAVAIVSASHTAIGADFATGEAQHLRRLNKIEGTDIRFVVTKSENFDDALADLNLTVEYPVQDNLGNGGATGAIVGADPFPLEEPLPSTGNTSRDGVLSAKNNGVIKNTIAEIDIKVDSIAVTAQTKKLKAKWSPELGQDLNAYHNLDAEVELTGILSEQIALEIDRELLDELITGAKAGTRYWSRAPGLFVNSEGTEIGASSAAPDFTGTVSEWYETLIETINDVSAQIHRKTLRGGANFVVCSPEVANILEFTSGFRASVTADQDRGTIGAVRAGSLSKKFDVYVDPYFLRNVLLVGRKGNSFLESGFVYAPYVPLQVTPTIFGTEDFVPRKGVMTRYAKKMVRPDMYGLVVVRGLLGEAGATS